jgi:hypothetical protein
MKTATSTPTWRPNYLAQDFNSLTPNAHLMSARRRKVKASGMRPICRPPTSEMLHMNAGTVFVAARKRNRWGQAWWPICGDPVALPLRRELDQGKAEQVLRRSACILAEVDWWWTCSASPHASGGQQQLCLNLSICYLLDFKRWGR